MAPPDSKLVQRVRSWPRRVVISIAIVAGVLLAARIALPIVLERAINQRLQRIPGYTGHVQNVDVHLWRGAYTLHGLDISKQDGHIKEPFVHARDIDFSLAWRELLHRKVVSEIRVAVGQLTFVVGPDPTRSQTDVDRRWQDVIQALFPIDITHLEITDGLLRYINTTREPAVDLYVTHMRAIATGLRNRRGEEGSGEFPAQVTIEGESLGGGRLHLTLESEPLAAQPHFHLSLKLDQVNLPELNQSLRAYANVDVGRGTFRLVGEMAANDGGFRGYIKPFFENLDFNNLADQDEGLGHMIWEKLVAVFNAIVKNKERDQLATRIPFEGRFGDAKFGMLATIGNVFRHGFIRAFNPTVEGSVHADAIKPNGKTDPAKEKQEEKADPPKKDDGKR